MNILTEVTLRPEIASTFLTIGVILGIASLVLFICGKKGWGALFLIAGIFCVLFATCNGFQPRWQ